LRITAESLKQVLAKQTGWTESHQLAETFDVTPRTIRNYVHLINAGLDDPPIESSYRGYRLRQTANGAQTSFPDIHETRAGRIVKRLLGARDSISIYDVADSFCVSDSTIEGDLHQVRQMLEPFGLELARSRDQLYVRGAERDKRRLINKLILGENPGAFTSIVSQSAFDDEGQARRLRRCITTSLCRNDLHFNDLGLSTIELHALIMINRIRQGRTILSEEETYDEAGQAYYVAAREICRDISEQCQVLVTPDEVGFFSLIIMSNTSRVGSESTDTEYINKHIDQDSLDLASHATHHLEQAYLLDPFDRKFVTQLGMHVHSLMHRIPNGLFAQNPLANEIKATYPLIHDMAVYLSNYIGHRLKTTLNEDEISFIALHIGGYFEKHSQKLSLQYGGVTCAFLYVSYHDIHQAALERIESALGGDIIMVKVCSVTDYRADALCCDLVISPVEIDRPRAGRVIRISPLLTNDDLDRVICSVEEIRAKKQGALALNILQKFLRPTLFERGFQAQDEEDAISKIVDRCVRQGLCDSTFRDDVIMREKISSTAFGSQVAVPHSMSASTWEPFLFVAASSKPIPWNSQSVSLILLIGINEDSRREFKLLFDVLSRALRSGANVRQLIRADSYEDMVELLESMVIKASCA